MVETDEFVVGITFQRETFTSQGKTEKEAQEKLREHIEAVLPLYQWQVEHAQNVVNDMTKWLKKEAEWRNGRRARLKIWCLKRRGGSSPSAGTNSKRGV